MNGAWLGFAAIVVFALLLVFFFAAVSLAPQITPVSGPAAASQPIVLATATAIPSSPAAAGVITYTVQSGEWLSSIAREYNTTVPAILAANPQITDSDAVRPGQAIRIPVP